MRYDAHDYKTRLEKVLAQIMADPSIPEKNKEAICRFQENCFIEGISTGRITRYLYDLRHISKWLGKEFEDVTKEDIRSLIGKDRKRNISKREAKRSPIRRALKGTFESR